MYKMLMSAFIVCMVIVSIAAQGGPTKEAAKESEIRVMVTVGQDLMILECLSADQKACKDGLAVHNITFIGKWKPSIVLEGKCQVNCK